MVGSLSICDGIIAEMADEHSSKPRRPHLAGTDWTVSQLAERHQLSANKIRSLFRYEPAVIHITGPKGRDSLRIPEVVEQRVFSRLGTPPPPPIKLFPRAERRTIRLFDRPRRAKRMPPR